MRDSIIFPVIHNATGLAGLSFIAISAPLAGSLHWDREGGAMGIITSLLGLHAILGWLRRFPRRCLRAGPSDEEPDTAMYLAEVIGGELPLRAPGKTGRAVLN
jgi:hypothetical protein